MLLLAENQPAARPAHRLVRRHRHDVGVRNRARVHPPGDQTGDMGHVDEQYRTEDGQVYETGQYPHDDAP